MVLRISNKYIVNLIAANILWSFIPIVVKGLFSEISILTIIFLRFLIGGISLFIIAILLVLINNHINDEKKISLKELFLNLRHKNQRFYSMRTYKYYFLIGFFGIIMHIVFYFLALKTTSIPFAMIGMLLTIIFITFYDKGVNLERFDVFRVLFITMLAFSITIIIFVSFMGAIQTGNPIEPQGFFYILMYSITGSFLYISIERDSFSKNELRNININRYYKIPRSLIKMAISFTSGILILLPIIGIVSLLPLELDITQEIHAFFSEISSIFDILQRWEIIYLIIFATILPYLLLFLANVNWKSKTLTYSQWSSIIGLIDPMSTLLFSVLLANEYFPHEYLIIVIVFLVITIILRYAHEVRNVVQAVIFLKIKKRYLQSLPIRILKFYGVRKIETLIGGYDLKIDVKVNSFKDYHYLINRKLKPLEEIISLEAQFVNNVEIL
ncbi:MAG: EamA family transporter [Promethearchaeota archaeon]|nr:MAG: EamA family transporter [Candidatus Lokiarchaeota archaeon]